jgi:hypothetical protein
MCHLAKSGTTITLAQALEALSATENGTDWNRYQAALKADRSAVETRKYPPHRIIAGRPGGGATAIIEALFSYEATHSKTIPLLILLFDASMPQYRAFDTTGWIHVHFTVDPAHPCEIKLPPLGNTDNIRGIVIKIIVITETPKHQEVIKLRAAALDSIIEQIPRWKYGIASSLGTVFIEGMEMVDTADSTYYDVKFPKMMAELRQQSDNQQLVIETQTDISKDSIYRSKDQYKLIKLTTFHADQYFTDCPLDMVSLGQASSNTKRYARLFTDESRRIEDTALYIGSVDGSLIRAELTTKNAFSTFIQNYMLAMVNQPRI